MIRVVHPGSRIRMLTFYPSRIPDVGSATLGFGTPDYRIMTYRMHISCVLAGACKVMRARRFVNAATRYSGRCVEDKKMSARWKKRALKI
jgi:hypothetical protein